MCGESWRPKASIELFIITILMIRGNNVWIPVVVYGGLVASETICRRWPGCDSLSAVHAVLLWKERVISFNWQPPLEVAVGDVTGDGTLILNRLGGAGTFLLAVVITHQRPSPCIACTNRKSRNSCKLTVAAETVPSLSHTLHCLTNSLLLLTFVRLPL